jgi:hypothetical protein
VSSVIDDQMADLRVTTVERTAGLHGNECGMPTLTASSKAEGNGIESILTNEGVFEVRTVWAVGS